MKYIIPNTNIVTTQEDPKKRAFLTKLAAFLKSRNKPFNRIPTLGHRELDLNQLYIEVTGRNGVQAVSTHF